MSVKTRIIVSVSLVLAYLMIAIVWRPIASDDWLVLLLGCLPNFIAVVAGGLFLNSFTPKKDAFKNVFLVTVTVLFYEFFHFTNTSGVGTTFDYYDVLATIIGCAVAIALEYYTNSKSIKESE